MRKRKRMMMKMMKTARETVRMMSDMLHEFLALQVKLEGRSHLYQSIERLHIN
jgi:hypothetical protein